MRITRLIFTTAVLSLICWGGAAAASTVSPTSVLGVVRGTQDPIDKAFVYAYRIEDLELFKVLSDVKGKFQFKELPTGLYQFIAFKAGYVPAVVQVSRADATKDLYLDLQLVEEEVGSVREGEAYWSALGQVPDDVLRQIELAQLGDFLPPDSRFSLNDAAFKTTIHAGTGVDDIVAPGEAQLSGGSLDLEGELAGMRMDLEGDFWSVSPTGFTDDSGRAGEGHSSALNFQLEGKSRSRLNISTRNDRLRTVDGPDPETVGFSNYQVTWSQELGERSHYRLQANLTDQQNFYSTGAIEPNEIPHASRVWEVEGSYHRTLGDRSTFETGLRYREHQSRLPSLTTADLFEDDSQRVDVFGRGGYRVRPAVLVEYGVYTIVRDGEMDVSPQGGVVLQMSPVWQAAAHVGGRLRDEAPTNGAPYRPDFYTVLHGETSAVCAMGEEICYKLAVTRQEGDATLSLGASHRKIGDTLRLYFSEDFFDQQESLYLVQGDRLPEVELAMSRKISPRILARLSSSLASGGGGVFYALGDGPYENEIRYLVTSLDTTFQATSTGVSLGFYQLVQQLNPVDKPEGERAGQSLAELESERLQLKLTQDLNSLIDLPADWAVLLDMQLARGNRSVDADEVYRRILGGIAVRF